MDPRQVIAHNLSKLTGGPSTSELVRRQVLSLVQRRKKLSGELGGLERRMLRMRERLAAVARESEEWRSRTQVALEGGREDLAEEARSRAEFCEREHASLERTIRRCASQVAQAGPELDAVSEALNGFLRKRGGEPVPLVPLVPRGAALPTDCLRAELDEVEHAIAWDLETREVRRRASESDRLPQSGRVEISPDPSA